MMESIYDRTVQLGEYVPEPDDDRIICRCEEVTKGEIRRAVHDGMFTITEIRRYLRCGMGLCQGSPEKIPVVKNDFIFSAICEELGGIFAICLILVCTSFFLMIVTIALKIRNPFYKLIALGLGTEYAFQVFLTIGGATKFIPMTGVTLPLVSYGGSSVMCTILMLAIIQGLYILREDEDEQIETQRKETIERRGKRATPERTGRRQAP